MGLNKELEVLDSYIFLLKMRHGESLQFKIDLSTDTVKNVWVLPHSLQMLAENAVKHNLNNTEDPLLVEIAEQGDELLISNNLNPRKLLVPGTGVGLLNIVNRYKISGYPGVKVSQTQHSFIVRLPIIERINEENINF